MPLSTAIAARASALDAQRARIEVAVSNIANAESTRGPDGKPYRRRDVVLQSEPIGFDGELGRAEALGVRVDDSWVDQSDFVRRYEPAHPGTDGQGSASVLHRACTNGDPTTAYSRLCGYEFILCYIETRSHPSRDDYFFF